jgi:hypothetical protein
MISRLSVKMTLSAALMSIQFWACPTSATAQLPQGEVGRNPITKPTISPYLNLFNRGNSAGFNYYNLVRPQQQMQRAAGQFSGEINSLQSSVSKLNQRKQTPTEAEPLTTGRMMTTGHSTSFGSTGGYFPGGVGNRGGGGQGNFGSRPGQR